MNMTIKDEIYLWKIKISRDHDKDFSFILSTKRKKRTKTGERRKILIRQTATY